MLTEMAEVEDVRDYLKTKLDLRKNLQIHEEDFITWSE